jgi:hypothetical protein
MVHNKFLGLDCVLLLYGKKSECNVSEEYGQVVECEFEEGVPDIPQLVFNKWHYTRNEPETTWLIGDIDQIPLQKEHFVDSIKNVPEDHYVHLAEDAFTVNWKTKRERLVGHYHVAKGKVFNEALDLNVSLVDHVKNMVFGSQKEKKSIWAYEEWYTADLIKANNYLNKFTGVSRSPRMKIDRQFNCSFDSSPSNKNNYVDIHCPRPFKKNKAQIEEVLSHFWGRI